LGVSCVLVVRPIFWSAYIGIELFPIIVKQIVIIRSLVENALGVWKELQINKKLYSTPRYAVDRKRDLEYLALQMTLKPSSNTSCEHSVMSDPSL
jgi:hypothetical protein